MHDPCLIHTKKLSTPHKLAHGDVHALKQADLQIFQGQSVAIMGPSGSGKSTLLHLLGCLDRPTDGQYYLNSRDVSGLNDEELAFVRGTHLGFVFQSFNLIPQLSVYENIEIPFLYHPAPKSDEEVRISILRALERVRLQHRMHHLPSQLSGGEAQRVAIARALAIEPLVILADEPTGNLDSDTGRSILQLFQELNRQGVTLIMVTHDEQVAAYCKRIIRMRDGQIVVDQINPSYQIGG